MYPLTQRTDRILISCAGVGMGNASRVIAIVEALAELAEDESKKISFHIVTWGSAYKFLREYQRESDLSFELIHSHGYSSAEDLLSPRGVAATVMTFTRNLRFLRQTVKHLRPSLILLDSDYHFPAYFRAGCPIVYIGQANDVIERAKRDDYRPASWRERVNFACREKLDSLLQETFSNWILVPSFRTDDRCGDKIKKIPLIVRKEFLEHARTKNGKESVGILLSGSELEKSAFLALSEKYGLKILTPGKDGPAGTVPSHAESLDEFDIIFTQGGLSSISECIARAKFLVVFPMRHHPEQSLNANEVEQLGLGMRSRLEDLEKFPELLKKAVRRKTRVKKSAVDLNGAEVAAGFLFRTLSNSEREGQPLPG